MCQGPGFLNRLRRPALFGTLGAVMLGLVTLAPTTAAAEPMRLSPDSARSYATSLLRQGQASAARALAQVLLQADPEDLQALLILVDAEILLNNPKAARAAARQAWALADSDRDRFLAAMARSAALAEQGHYLAAQLWLRRASGLASSPGLKQVVARRFRGLSAQSPTRLSFSGSFAPSSNVNGGSGETEMMWFTPFGPMVASIPVESQALAGWKISAGVTLDRRLSRGANHVTQASLGLKTTQLHFTDAAREALLDDGPGGTGLPLLTSGELATHEVELALSHQWRFSGRAPVWRASLAVSHGWLGGEDQTDTLFASLGVFLPDVGPGDLSLSLTGQARTRLDDPSYSSELYGASLSYTLPVQSPRLGGRLTLSLGTREAIGRIQTQDYSSVQMGAFYRLGKPVAGNIGLGLGLDWEDRQHESSFFTPGQPMWIRSLNLKAEATLNGLSVMGFSPLVTLSHGRNRSNVPLYSNDQTSLSLGVRSSF